MAYDTTTLRRAEQILGYGITSGTGEREYTVVDGVVYTDAFEGSVTIDGFNGDMKLTFNGSQATDYKNEINLKTRLQAVKVTAAWGSSTLEGEIKDLLDWLGDDGFADNADDAKVQSKRIEDFYLTLKKGNEASESLDEAIYNSFGFYVRSPLIVSVTKEQRDGGFYF